MCCIVYVCAVPVLHWQPQHRTLYVKLKGSQLYSEALSHTHTHTHTHTHRNAHWLINASFLYDVICLTAYLFYTQIIFVIAHMHKHKRTHIYVYYRENEYGFMYVAIATYIYMLSKVLITHSFVRRHLLLVHWLRPISSAILIRYNSKHVSPIKDTSSCISANKFKCRWKTWKYLCFVYSRSDIKWWWLTFKIAIKIPSLNSRSIK